MKVLFSHYTNHLKGDNESLDCKWVDEDTPESRKQAINKYGSSVDWYESTNDFINGNINKIHFVQIDDHNNRILGCFTICSKEKAFEEVEKTYQNEKSKLMKLFGEEK